MTKLGEDNMSRNVTELPFGIGDTVYVIELIQDDDTESHYEYFELEVYSIHITRYNCQFGMLSGLGDFGCSVDIRELGHTVFLNEKDAEKKVDEINKCRGGCQ